MGYTYSIEVFAGGDRERKDKIVNKENRMKFFATSDCQKDTLDLNEIKHFFIVFEFGKYTPFIPFHRPENYANSIKKRHLLQ